MCILVTQSCPIFCDPMDCSLIGSSIHGILQAKILEWVVMSFFRWSSWPRNWIRFSCTAGRFFTVSATREACRRKEREFHSSRPCWEYRIGNIDSLRWTMSDSWFPKKIYVPDQGQGLITQELFCSRILLKWKRDRENFWHRHQKGDGECPPR